jgi:hypothetical protein
MKASIRSHTQACRKREGNVSKMRKIGKTVNQSFRTNRSIFQTDAAQSPDLPR